MRGRGGKRVGIMYIWERTQEGIRAMEHARCVFA